MARLFVILMLVYIAFGCPMYAHCQTNYQPQKGYVPDAKTAIRIAIAVWSPIYGEKQIQGEKPYHATLNHGVWTVTGSLPEPIEASGFRSVVVGGVALAEISKKSGQIIRVIHGK